MATAFASDLPTSTPPLARAAPKLALAASAGTATLAKALTQTPPTPPADLADAALVGAWAEWLLASNAIEASGPDAPEEVDAPHWVARTQAERVIVSTRSVSQAGVAVKLRFALAHEADQGWVYRAICEGDDASLFARSDELDHQARLLVDAIAALVLPTDTMVRDAFEAWVSARYGYDASDEGEGGDDGPLYREIIRAERALADLPARTPDDMLYKLMPLALHEHGPDLYDNTFTIRWSPSIPGTDYLEDRTWRGLIDSMLALSPRIREIVAMPHPRPPAGHPDMTLPQDGVPVDQMTDWLDRLVGDGPRYAKLWLRLMDAAKVEVYLRTQDGAEQLWTSSTGFSVECLAAEQALKAHLVQSGYRQAVEDQLRMRAPNSLAVGLLAERQKAFAAAEQSAADTDAHSRWLAEVIRLEGWILHGPAATKDDLLAKSLLAVRLLAEGSEINEACASEILTQAEELGLPVTAKVLEDAHG